MIREPVQERLEQLVQSGGEVGLQTVVIADGEVVADACAGVVSADGDVAVSPGTLFFAGSAAKGVLSSLTHVLVARGALDYTLRLAEAWPEFAAHGKEGVTVRHVLMHQAGVPGLRADLRTEELCDWSAMCAELADAIPWWPPGERFGYHAQTFGFLLGATLERVTGVSLRTLLRRTLTEPLSIAEDVHFGVPADQLSRVATQMPAAEPLPAPQPGSPMAAALPPGARPDAAFANRHDVLTAQIPSMGTMSARGAARLYAGLLGHVPGVELLDHERLSHVAAVAYTGPDAVMEMPSVSWALGYSPSRPHAAAARPGSTFGMVGTNGTAAFADIDTGVAVAVMRNRFSPDLAAATAVDEIISEAHPPRRTTS